MFIEPFLERCARYGDSREISQARLSTLLFGSGVTLDRIRSGKGITTRVLERAIERLDHLERTKPAKAPAEATTRAPA